MFLFIHSTDIQEMGWEYKAPLLAQVLSLLLLALTLESVRRTGGLIFFLFCTLFAFFPLFTTYMPSLLNGKGLPFWRTVNYHGMGPESLIGIPLTVVGTLLIGFMVFAVALQKTGAGDFFNDLAQSLLGTKRGGTAKVSVFSSALFGMISGSVVSNVLGTGSFTIPAMKKSGYTAKFAGAVEACSSTGGTLMPPVMGATAFVMAQVLGVSYATIVKAAIIPSLLYFGCLMVQVDAHAALHGIKGTSKEECPRLKDVIKKGWPYIISVIILVIFIMFLWREAQAPWYAVVVLIATTFFIKEAKLTIKRFFDLIEGAGKFLAELASILAGAGLIIGSMAVTGVAHSFSYEMVTFAGGNIGILLILGAFTSLILGMGMTITACYIFLAIAMAPALISVGYEPIAVHLFVLYWGMASFITPPVALGAFAAATISGANPIATGLQSMRLGIATYFIPFFFVLQPALILIGPPLTVISAIFTCFVGVTLIGSSIEGYVLGIGKIPSWGRPILFIAGMLLAIPESRTDFIGFVLAVIILGWIFLLKRREIKNHS